MWSPRRQDHRMSAPASPRRADGSHGTRTLGRRDPRSTSRSAPVSSCRRTDHRWGAAPVPPHREPLEIEVMHGVEGGHEVDRPIRQGEPLGLAPQRHPGPAPAVGEHGVAAIGGQNPRPLGENSLQQLRVTTGTGPNVDAQEGLVRKSITYEQHRVVIRISKRFVTGCDALEVLLGHGPLPRGVRARQGAIEFSHPAEPICALSVRRMVRRRSSSNGVGDELGPFRQYLAL